MMGHTTVKQLAFCAALLAGLPLAQASAQTFNRPKPINIDFGAVFIKPNLSWGDRTSYSLDGPQTRELYVQGFGIDDFVDVFETLEPFTISQDMVNKAGSSGGDYLINLTIRRMVFRSLNVGGQVVTGWVSGNDQTYEVYSEDIIGPPLAPNEMFRAEFADIDPTMDFTNLASARCGLFEATLTVDDDGMIDEANESDNQVKHYFFIPSDQVFDLTIAPPAPREFNTSISGPHVAFSVILMKPALGLAPVPVFYKAFTVNGGLGISMTTAPAPNPTRLITLNGPTPITINGFVPPGMPKTSATGKVTVISQDGCVIKQESVKLNYNPPGSFFGFGDFFSLDDRGAIVELLDGSLTLTVDQ